MSKIINDNLLVITAYRTSLQNDYVIFLKYNGVIESAEKSKKGYKDAYRKAYKRLEEQLEYLDNKSIEEIVKRRDMNDNGARLTTQEVIEKRKQIIGLRIK